MNRITIVLDDDLLTEIDRMVEERRATRTGRRRSAIWLEADSRRAAEDANSRGDCVAALVYAYDHSERDLPKRLTKGRSMIIMTSPCPHCMFIWITTRVSKSAYCGVGRARSESLQTMSLRRAQGTAWPSRDAAHRGP